MQASLHISCTLTIIIWKRHTSFFLLGFHLEVQNRLGQSCGVRIHIQLYVVAKIYALTTISFPGWFYNF